MDASDNKKHVLGFVDEVLRGTNTTERIAASSAILRNLSEKGVLVFAATHDLELTSILDDIYDNYWEETRFLIGQEEGIAIRFVGSGRNYVSGQPFFRSSNIEIYKVNVDNAKPELYTEEKYYFWKVA